MISLFSCILLSLWLFPSSLEAKKTHQFVLCTWNIGHFSNGSKPYSMINVIDYKRYLEKYRLLIYNEVHPDVITVNEYNRDFCGDGIVDDRFQTSSLLFNNFEKMIIGPQHYWGICNAVFSNLKIKNSTIIYFESHKKTDGDDFTKSRENYYIESDLFVNKKRIKLVCFHLLFSRKVDEIYHKKLIEELISHYEKMERVILCGDWNTVYYSALREAGYSLANDGSFKTFPSKSYSLDNIVVKGLKINNVRMIKTDLSDHYPLVCDISL